MKTVLKLKDVCVGTKECQAATLKTEMGALKDQAFLSPHQ